METNASSPTAQLQSIMVVLAVIAYRRWDIRAMDVSMAFLMSWLVKRATYAKLPDGAGKDNMAWEILRPLYGMSTSCKGSYETIRDFLAGECGGEVTSLGKSVSYRIQHGLEYGYWGGGSRPRSCGLR